MYLDIFVSILLQIYSYKTYHVVFFLLDKEVIKKWYKLFFFILKSNNAFSYLL